MSNNITFSDFVLKQASNVGVFLGKREHPMLGKKTVNIQAAKGSMDVLYMLREKTEGNLSGSEKTLLNDTIMTLDELYDKTTQFENQVL